MSLLALGSGCQQQSKTTYVKMPVQALTTEKYEGYLTNTKGICASFEDVRWESGWNQESPFSDHVFE